MQATNSLHTDLYQITMMAAYFHNGKHNQKATCELFVRRLPKKRRFLLAAGLERCLEYLSSVRFTDAQIESLKEIPVLRPVMTQDFIEYLRAFRFTGDVYAVPEGTVMFGNEPFLRVEAPLAEAQLVETFLLSCINHNTMIASKAARIVLASEGKPLLEFGTRRTHYDSAVDVARASYIAGFEGSSNVEAFHAYEVPTRGTMAHMFIMANGNEKEAFEEYAKVFKDSSYLVDTYDTLQGVRNLLEVVGDNVSAVRLDSGDLGSLSKEVRALLKELGREDVKIFVSSDLDEYALSELATEGDFDSAGIGTRLAASYDSPSLGGVYKLVEIEGRPVAKFSEGKVTLPGPHQVYRAVVDGKMDGDIIGATEEGGYHFLSRTKLLIPVMVSGKITFKESIHQMRTRAREQIEMLSDELKVIDISDEYVNFYNVESSNKVDLLLEECRKEQLGE